jgi:general secretion pathway protein A
VTLDDRSHPSIADDPDFQASLSELDEDFGPPGRIQVATRRADATANSPAVSPASPSAEAEWASNPPERPRAPAPPRASGGAPRRLLDLFPPSHTVPSPTPGAPVALPRVRPTAPEPIVAESARATSDTFYGLNERPFSLSTDPRFFFHSTVHDHVAQALLGAIGRREGLVVLTGESGLGKTTLCRAVIDQLDRRTLTSFVAEPFASTESLLKTVLADFGVISRDDATRRLANAARADLLATLQHFLVSLAALQAFAVVILDEAHELPLDVLDQVRALAESLGEEPLLQIVLVGQPSLDRALERNRLRELRQRIGTRCRLRPIEADEIAGYIAHRVGMAGAHPRVEFDEGAASRVYALTGGVPRVINLLCDRALETGFKASANVIDAPLVDAAAGELNLANPSRSGWKAKLAMAAAMLMLVALGAAAAAYVFRSDLSAVVSAWRNPPGPGSPQPVPAPPAGSTPPLR